MVDVVDFVAGGILQEPQTSTGFNRIGHNPFNSKYLKIGHLAKSRFPALGAGGPQFKSACPDHLVNSLRLSLPYHKLFTVDFFVAAEIPKFQQPSQFIASAGLRFGRQVSTSKDHNPILPGETAFSADRIIILE
jgi:hypothetical protein